MDIQHISQRAKNIIVEPQKEWLVIEQETSTSNELLQNYALPFFVLSALATVAGNLMSQSTMVQSLLHGGISLVVDTLTILLAIFFMTEVSEKFQDKADKNAVSRFLIYGFTPSYLVSILVNLSFHLGLLGLLGFYSIYLLWQGLPVMLKTPKEHQSSFFILTIATLFGIEFALKAILVALLQSYL